MTKKQYLTQLSLADLIALHTNYWLVQKQQPGARYGLITPNQFLSVEQELNFRISNVDLTPINDKP